MSIGQHDFEINGVKYNAAEDAEGEHYVLNGEPLRPPNAVTVQGENSQKFQMRPDTLLWSLTDWSGGEGQIKYDSKQPNRHRVLQSVRVFERPGTLTAGYGISETIVTSSTALAVEVFLISVNGTLYAYQSGTSVPNLYTWNDSTKEWSAAATITGPTNGASAVTTDGEFVYWAETGTDDIWRGTPGSTAPTAITTTGGPTGATSLAPAGDYLFVSDDTAALEIYEVAKDGSAAIAIVDYFTTYADAKKLLQFEGKVYAMASNYNETQIREVVPTSAAGPAFGREVATVPGFRASDMWVHSGLLYLSGWSGDDFTTHVIFYLDIHNGSYGSLGRVRPEDSFSTTFVSNKNAGFQNVRMLDHFAASTRSGASYDEPSLWQFDAVTGGYAVLAFAEDFTLDNTVSALAATSLAVHDQDIFWVARADSSFRTLYARRSTYTKNSSAISAWHDFDLADEKILSSLVLSTEALPADWTVFVDYAIDGSTTFTNAVTYTTDGGKGTKTQVSTDSSTIKFRTLSIRIRLSYTGAGVPTSAPVVLGVDALAMVAKPVRVWRLLLDLSDDESRHSGQSGAAKKTNLETAAALQSVIAFKDGYNSPLPGRYTEYDVVIDQYAISLSLPGEGTAFVVLKETA